MPYVFSMVIWVAPISAYYFDFGFIDIFKKYILCINPSQLWFLWMLFGVFIIAWPIRKVLIQNPMVGWGIVIAFYGVGIVGDHIIPNVFCIWTSCEYVIFFYIGIRIRVKSENREKLLSKYISWILWLLLDLVLFSFSLYLNDFSGFIFSIITIILNVLLHVVGAVMAWSILQMLARRISWQDNKTFIILSTYSMPMYLFHQQFIYFSITALNGVVNPWVNVGVNFVVAVVGSLALSRLFMQWKVTRFLIGEK